MTSYDDCIADVVIEIPTLKKNLFPIIQTQMNKIAQSFLKYPSESYRKLVTNF